MNMHTFLFFDNMITPRLITIIYWILLAVVVIGGVGSMFATGGFGGFLAGLIGIVVGVLFVRIWCELLIVIFKINEALQEMRNRG